MSPPADGKHEAPDRPRQQHAPTNGNHGDDSIRGSPGSKGGSNDSMEDLHGTAVIIRIGIPDLQQTVSLVWKLFVSSDQSSETNGVSSGAITASMYYVTFSVFSPLSHAHLSNLVQSSCHVHVLIMHVIPFLCFYGLSF